MFLIFVVPFIIAVILIYFEIKMARQFYRKLNLLKGLSSEELQFELEKAQHEVEKKVTKHKIHLVLSLLTVGLWAPIWLYISYLNSLKRKNTSRLIEEIKSN